jgi:hypothetical protein
MISIKKIIVTLVVLTIGFASCSNCRSDMPTVTANVPVVAAPITKITTDVNDDMSVSLPGEWLPLDGPPDTGSTGYSNGKLIVVLAKLPIGNSFEQFVLFSVMELKQSGAEVYSAKQIELNGTNLVLLDLSRNNTKFWVWLAWKSSVGYILTCGGEFENIPHDLCFEIAKSFRIKS